MEITVELGGWDHGCCGPAIERNQLVDLGCIRTTGPDGQAVYSEVRHNVGPPVRVRGRVTDLLVVKPDGTTEAIHRVPSGAELTPLDQEEVVLLQEAWTLTPIDAGTEFLVIVEVAGGPIDLESPHPGWRPTMQFSQMTSTGAAGGESEPSEDALERWHRSHQQPDNEVPVAVPLTAVLARTADLAVVLSSVQAASTGFGFEVSVRTRQSPPPGQDVYGQFMSNAGAGGQFLLGVEFPDGRRASVLDPFAGWPPTSSTSAGELPVTLSGAGGGGGGRRFDHRWWVSPLPPPGPLRVVVRWDAQDLPETIVELDGEAIAAAGASCQELWPWEPERSDDFEQQQEALRPTAGWFSQNPGR